MEIRKLNMLRGLAALIVAVSHFSNSTNWLHSILGRGAGHIGVMLFFILSGFLMSYLYMGKESNKFNMKIYAVSRVARVFPLFFLIVIFSYILQKIGVVGVLYKISNAKNLLSHLSLIYGVNVLWTIGPEIQFYMLFALIWRFTSLRPGYLFILLALTLTLLFFTDFPRPRGNISGLRYNFPLFQSLPYFLIGLIFGKYYSSFRVPDYIQSGWFILALCLIPLMYPRIFTLITGVNHRMWSDIGVFVVLSVVFFSVVFLVPNNNVLMANKIGDFLGKISYSLYLLHIPILWRIEILDFGSTEIQLLAFLVCTLALSYISYRLIEVPSSKLIRKFAFNKSIQPDATSASLQLRR